jgi:hypothetical protein
LFVARALGFAAFLVGFLPEGFAVLRARDFAGTVFFFAAGLRADRFFAVADFADARFFLVAMTRASGHRRCRTDAAPASLALGAGAVNHVEFNPSYPDPRTSGVNDRTIGDDRRRNACAIRDGSIDAA